MLLRQFSRPISDISFTLISCYILHKKVKLSWPSVKAFKTQCNQPKLTSFLVIGQQLITPLKFSDINDNCH
ncbi:hypothetical protein CMT41_06240 [Colwellia sp. MT41]|nr:hypothetical protein CMT41_06240 [Colwellia sp. MT41]